MIKRFKMTWIDERHTAGFDEFYMYDSTEKYYENVDKTANYIINDIWNCQLKPERGELPRTLISVKELQMIPSEEFTGCYDKKTDEVYLCHFGEHYNALKKLLSDMLVREGIVSDRPVNKDVKTTGTMHIIKTMAFIPDIPEKYYEICDKYIKENVIMKSEYIGGLNPNSYKH